MNNTVFDKAQREWEEEPEDYERPEHCEVCGSIVVGNGACKACANLEEVGW